MTAIAERDSVRVGGVNPDIDGDAAAIGELDAVVDQIHQNLAQPRGVAAHPGRQVVADRRLQGQALGVRLTMLCRHRVLDQSAWIERNLLQFQASGVQSREIQNVLDQ